MGTEVTGGTCPADADIPRGDPWAGSAQLQGQARSLPARPAAPLAPGFAGKGAAGDGKPKYPSPRSPSAVLWGSPGTGAAPRGGGLHPTSRVQGSGQPRRGRETFGAALGGRLASWLFSQIKGRKKKHQTRNVKKTFRVGPVALPVFSPSSFKAGHGTGTSTGTGPPASRLPPEHSGEPGSSPSPTATGALQKGWLVISWKNAFFPHWKIPFHGNNGIFFPLFWLLMILLSLLMHAGPVQQHPSSITTGPLKRLPSKSSDFDKNNIASCIYVHAPSPYTPLDITERLKLSGEKGLIPAEQ